MKITRNFETMAVAVAMACGSVVTPASACPVSGLDHVAVLVDNTDAVLGALKTAFDISAFPERMEMSDPGFGTIHLTYAAIAGGWIEFVEPEGAGPMADLLKRSGSGAIIELNFETGDLDACAAWLAKRGVRMTDVDGKAFGDGQVGSVVKAYGMRFAYVDPALTYGATVEFFQRTARADDFLRRRDAWLRAQRRQPSVAFDSVNVTVGNLDASAASFAKLGFAAKADQDFCAPSQCRSVRIDNAGMSIRLIEMTDLTSSDPAASEPDTATSLSFKPVILHKHAHDKRPTLQPGLVIVYGKGAAVIAGLDSATPARGLRLLIGEQ